MATALESMIEIPALLDGKKVIIPAFRISFDFDISNYGEKALNVYKQAPTLAQLRHGYSESAAIRENVHARLGRGEFTADFVDYNAQKPRGKVVPRGFLYVKLYQRPDSVSERNELWIAEGKSVEIELPPSGWQVPDRNRRLYDSRTGFPLRTIDDREKAVKELARIMPEDQAREKTRE